MSHLLIRSWEGRTKPGSADAYVAHLADTVLPEIQALPGCIGARVLRGAADGDSFMVLTEWESLEAIQRFSGSDAEVAVVPPEARALLSQFDERARHFEVVIDTTGGSR